MIASMLSKHPMSPVHATHACTVIALTLLEHPMSLNPKPGPKTRYDSSEYTPNPGRASKLRKKHGVVL